MDAGSVLGVHERRAAVLLAAMALTLAGCVGQATGSPAGTSVTPVGTQSATPSTTPRAIPATTPTVASETPPGSAAGDAIPQLGLTDLATLGWQSADLMPSESEIVATMIPWRGGFIAAGASLDFERALASPSPSGNPLDNLVQGEVWRSADGLHWEHLPPDTTFAGATIRILIPFGDGLLAVGSLGVCLPDACGGLPPNGGTAVWSSPDGVAWARVPEGGLGPAAVSSMVVVGDTLVAAGYVADTLGKSSADGFGSPSDAAAWTSTDGRAWTPATMDPRGDGASSLVVDGPSVVALVRTGYTSQAWRSLDGGQTWAAADVLGDVLVDAGGARAGSLLLTWRDADFVRTLVTAIPAASGPLTSTRPSELENVEATSITSTGPAVLLAGNRLERDADDLLNQVAAVLYASDDLASWTAVDVPAAWKDAPPWATALGVPGLLVEVRAPYPASPASAALFWLGSPGG
ncbi:MAG: hypothetical protein WCK58_02905 [Chloroflexota bacterium]